MKMSKPCLHVWRRSQVRQELASTLSALPSSLLPSLETLPVKEVKVTIAPSARSLPVACNSLSSCSTTSTHSRRLSSGKLKSLLGTSRLSIGPCKTTTIPTWLDQLRACHTTLTSLSSYMISCRLTMMRIVLKIVTVLFLSRLTILLRDLSKII